MSTKDRLLYVLKKNNPLTMSEITSYFSISEAAIRKHLHELEKQQFIQKKTIKQEIGRPYHKYMLTDKGHSTFPNQYDTLPIELLRDLEDLYGEEAVSNLLDIARIRDENGYMVEVEQTDRGDYIFKHYNCPIANIASEYDQVCENEKIVMEKIFPHSHVISHTCITKGDNVCKWTISRPAEDEY